MYFLGFPVGEETLQIWRPLQKDSNGHQYEGFVNADGEYDGPGFFIEEGFKSVSEGFWKDGKREG